MKSVVISLSILSLLLSAALFGGASPLSAPPQLSQPAIIALPDAVAARLPDVVRVAELSQVTLSGYLGARVLNSEKNRLLAVDEDDLLDAFERRDAPHQEWQGEHAGKFLHAATLAWANSNDGALKTKLDRVVARLLKTQQSDGYLGTYPLARRWTGWDVWAHKYDLIGLLTYYGYTGDAKSLTACRRIGDLLVATFPARKSIIAAGEHQGMAATSVLEPMVLLYRATGEARYLEFARYILRAWDEPGGPKVLSTLLQTGKVNLTANGKAYEMLSNLVGLCELARATGDRTLLVPVENAQRDIVAHQLYLTGTTSHGEHFGKDDDLPDAPGANMGETCVTVTWIQLNAQLLRLTGQARYADQLETSCYNHLTGAQRPDGAQWCYYTPLQGTKPFTDKTNCCLSSGPRGIAMLPAMAYLKYFEGGKESLAINLFESSHFATLLNGQKVAIEQRSQFPRRGASLLTLRLQKPATFGLKVRTPTWASPLSLRVAGRRGVLSRVGDGWTTIAPRRWKDGDAIAISFALQARRVKGEGTNVGREAVKWGPLVLAYDEKLNAGGAAFNAVALSDASVGLELALLTIPTSASNSRMTSARAPLIFTTPAQTARRSQIHNITLVPFAEASSAGGRFAVWLRTPQSLEKNPSLLSEGQPSRSHEGNISGDIADGDTQTYVVTFDGRAHDADWFAIQLASPLKIGRIVFAHGHNFHDGGWFDTSKGKPQVQVQREKDGPWQSVGTLDDYPATSGAQGKALTDGQTFTLRLPLPILVVAVRVIGKSAGGDQSVANFASAAELQAFAN